MFFVLTLCAKINNCSYNRKAPDNKPNIKEETILSGNAENINEENDHSLFSLSSPNKFKNNSSLITNSGQSTAQLTILNQSAISSINNQTQNSSGFNGSSTCISNTNNTINMSLDSVVDKFGDE